VILHLQFIQVVEKELGYLLNNDGIWSIEEGFLGVESYLFFMESRWKEVWTYEHIFQKDILELGVLIPYNFEFLESL
jgi:hypothetical protein